MVYDVSASPMQGMKFLLFRDKILKHKDFSFASISHAGELHLRKVNEKEGELLVNTELGSCKMSQVEHLIHINSTFRDRKFDSIYETYNETAEQSLKDFSGDDLR